MAFDALQQGFRELGRRCAWNEKIDRVSLLSKADSLSGKSQPFEADRDSAQ
jgi:hypothetical protein